MRLRAASSKEGSGSRRENAPSVGTGPGAIAFTRMRYAAHSTAGALDQRHHRVEPLLAPPEQDRARAQLGETPGHLRAQPAAPARDHESLVFQQSSLEHARTMQGGAESINPGAYIHSPGLRPTQKHFF